MARAKWTRIGDMSFLTKEIEILYFFTHAERATLADVAAYCGIEKPTTHRYVVRLKNLQLIEDDKKLNGYFFLHCKDNEKVRKILKDVPPGIIDTQKEIVATDPTKPREGQGMKIAGVLFTAQELRTLAIMLKSNTPMTVDEVMAASGFSQAYTYANMLELVHKRLVRKLGVGNNKRSARYQLEDVAKVKKLLKSINVESL